MLHRFAAFLCLLFGLVSPNSAATEGFVLRATTQMLSQPLAYIFDGQAKVEALLGPGVDPHTYQPTRADVRSLIEADAVVYHGLLFEAQVIDLMGQLSRRIPTIATAAYQAEADLLFDSGLPDPHTWHDPVPWIDAVISLSRTLDAETELSLSEDRIQILREAARRTDAWIAAVYADIDPARRIVVSAHDAFQYYGVRFGIRFEPLLGLSTASETRLSRLNELVELVATRGLSAVFSETTVEASGIAALREGAARRGLNLRALPPLYSDALAPAGKAGATYFGMLIENTRNIADAMSGTRPVPPNELTNFLVQNRLLDVTPNTELAMADYAGTPE